VKNNNALENYEKYCICNKYNAKNRVIMYYWEQTRRQAEDHEKKEK
jgi:hypothetical protein